MGKTILRRAIGEAVELAKDTGREAVNQTKEIVKGVVTAPFGDLNKATSEQLQKLEEREKKVKGADIGALKRVLAEEVKARQQLAQEAQTRTQQGQRQVARQELSPVALPGSVSHKPGLFRTKKANTAMSLPVTLHKVSSIETKHAGRD